MSYVAQIERENIKIRQKEGIRLAKKRGIKFGRPAKKQPAYFDDICDQYERGMISLREGAKALNISHVTLLKWLKQRKKLTDDPVNKSRL